MSNMFEKQGNETIGLKAVKSSRPEHFANGIIIALFQEVGKQDLSILK